MNREIEFRGKHSDSWIYGYLLKDDGKYYIAKRSGLGSWYYVKTETIGQYTGLKDKNGKKIFKGDIIHHDNIVDNADYVVEYKEGIYCGVRDNKYRSEEKIYLKLYMVELSDLEVIGNIYEKELQKD